MPRKRTKRADGRYQLKRKMPDGSSRFFYGKTITEAQDKYESACRQIILDEQKQNGGATFREMAQAYRNYITGQGTPIKCSTIKSYKRYLKIFAEHFWRHAHAGDRCADRVRAHGKYEGKRKVPAHHHQRQKRVELRVQVLVCKLPRHKRSGAAGCSARRDEARPPG